MGAGVDPAFPTGRSPGCAGCGLLTIGKSSSCVVEPNSRRPAILTRSRGDVTGNGTEPGGRTPLISFSSKIENGADGARRRYESRTVSLGGNAAPTRGRLDRFSPAPMSSPASTLVAPAPRMSTSRAVFSVMSTCGAFGTSRPIRSLTFSGAPLAFWKLASRMFDLPPRPKRRSNCRVRSGLSLKNSAPPKRCVLRSAALVNSAVKCASTFNSEVAVASGSVPLQSKRKVLLSFS